MGLQASGPMSVPNGTAPSKAIPLTGEEGQPDKEVRNILTKARVSWLRNTEVFTILQAVESMNLPLSNEPPCMPSSGQLYLFNRKHVRFFRKDGWSWKKKGDGKTVKEVHEKLKIGAKEVLNCYYAHAEDGIQRRCYWILDKDDHIVLVHYLDTSSARMAQRSSYIHPRADLATGAPTERPAPRGTPVITLSFSGSGVRSHAMHPLNSAPSAPPGASQGAGAFTITTGTKGAPSAAFRLVGRASAPASFFSARNTAAQHKQTPAKRKLDEAPLGLQFLQLGTQEACTQGSTAAGGAAAHFREVTGSILGGGRGSEATGGKLMSPASSVKSKPVFTVTTSINDAGQVMAVAGLPGGHQMGHFADAGAPRVVPMQAQPPEPTLDCTGSKPSSQNAIAQDAQPQLLKSAVASDGSACGPAGPPQPSQGPMQGVPQRPLQESGQAPVLAANRNKDKCAAVQLNAFGGTLQPSRLAAAGDSDHALLPETNVMPTSAVPQPQAVAQGFPSTTVASSSKYATAMDPLLTLGSIQPSAPLPKLDVPADTPAPWPASPWAALPRASHARSDQEAPRLARGASTVPQPRATSNVAAQDSAKVDLAILEAARDLQLLGGRRAGALPSIGLLGSGPGPSRTPEATHALLAAAAAAATKEVVLGPRPDPDCPGRLLSAFSVPARKCAGPSRTASHGLPGFGLPAKPSAGNALQPPGNEHKYSVMSAFETGGLRPWSSYMEQHCS